MRSSDAMRRWAPASTSAQPGKRPANSSARSVSAATAPASAAASRRAAISAASAPSVSMVGSTPRIWARSVSSLPPILRRLCSIRLRYEAEIPASRARSACRIPAIKRRSRIRLPVRVSRAMAGHSSFQRIFKGFLRCDIRNFTQPSRVCIFIYRIIVIFKGVIALFYNPAQYCFCTIVPVLRGERQAARRISRNGRDYMSKSNLTRRGVLKSGAVGRRGSGAADDLHRLFGLRLHQRAHRRFRHAGLQRPADRTLCRRGRGRAARLRTGGRTSERRRRRRHALHLLLEGAQGRRHPRQEGQVRHRRHPDQVGRRPRIGQVDDREGRRDHDHRRLVLGRRRGRAGAVPRKPA